MFVISENAGFRDGIEQVNEALRFNEHQRMLEKRRQIVRGFLVYGPIRAVVARLGTVLVEGQRIASHDQAALTAGAAWAWRSWARRLNWPKRST